MKSFPQKNIFPWWLVSPPYFPSRNAPWAKLRTSAWSWNRKNETPARIDGFNRTRISMDFWNWKNTKLFNHRGKKSAVFFTNVSEWPVRRPDWNPMIGLLILRSLCWDNISAVIFLGFFLVIKQSECGLQLHVLENKTHHDYEDLRGLKIISVCVRNYLFFSVFF